MPLALRITKPPGSLVTELGFQEALTCHFYFSNSFSPFSQAVYLPNYS